MPLINANMTKLFNKNLEKKSIVNTLNSNGSVKMAAIIGVQLFFLMTFEAD